MKANTYLIICDEENRPYWDLISGEIRRKLGQVSLHFNSTLKGKSLTQAAEVVIVDISDIETLHRVIREVHEGQPASRIIVVSSTPTWKQTREVLRLGAANLIRKSSDADELIDALQST
jgi:DNA-binding NarL/FixJ family response regulator